MLISINHFTQTIEINFIHPGKEETKEFYQYKYSQTYSKLSNAYCSCF